MYMEMKKFKCEELNKLAKGLKERKIPWEDCSDYMIERIHFGVHGNKWSAVNGRGTYGGYIANPEKNRGLIELCEGGYDPERNLAAADVLKKVDAELKKPGKFKVNYEYEGGFSFWDTSYYSICDSCKNKYDCDEADKDTILTCKNNIDYYKAKEEQGRTKIFRFEECNNTISQTVRNESEGNDG